MARQQDCKEDTPVNLSYFRRSSYTLEETIVRLKRQAVADGFMVLGETKLPDSGAVLVNLCKSRWADAIISKAPSLVGLLPCSVVVYLRDGKTMVGAGNPSILGGASDSTEIQELASVAEIGLRKLVDEVSGSGILKPSGLRLYSTKSCPYCRMEKSWLDSEKIAYELVYVDSDAGEAERLAARTGQMGVPVTEILYDDLESEFILGFDKPRLESMVGALRA